MTIEVQKTNSLRDSNMADQVGWKSSAPTDDTGSSSVTLSSSVSISSSFGDSNGSVRLEQEFSGATKEECERFMSHCEDEATAREYLGFLLAWREMHGHWESPEVKGKEERTPAEDWELAWELVWKRSASGPGTELYPPLPKNIHTSTKTSKVYPAKKMTQYVYVHQHPSNPQLIFLQVLPACIDNKAASPEQHGLAINIFLDLQLKRTDPHQKIMFVFDSRGQKGWPNPNLFSQRPIITMIPHLLVCLHAGRLEKMIIFPIPGWAVGFFDAVKMALPKLIREQVQLIPGSLKHMDVSKVATKAGISMDLFQQMLDQRQAIQIV